MSLLHPTSDYEIVIGLVAAVGTDLEVIETILRDRFHQFGYHYEAVRVSDLIRELASDPSVLREHPYASRLNSYMTAGNQRRREWQTNDAWAQASIVKIASKRDTKGSVGRTVWVIRSLKHPDEVETLREVYGPGFFLIGVYASDEDRLAYLIQDKNVSLQEARALVDRDADEQATYGQHTRDTFQLSDAFVASGHSQSCKEELWRVLDLLFGCPHLTPTPDEYAMFIAYSASLRSADLSRQVGAVVVSSEGELIATGANDVPRAGGGLYWEGQPDDQRDYQQGRDPNAEQRDQIVLKVMQTLQPDHTGSPEEILARGKRLLADSGLMDLTEYARAVHAEMEAILACARSGVSPRRGTLVATTFPCHNCAKHIVAAGIQRVVYIEPYPKSKASYLHDDAITLSPADTGTKVRFEPFVGVGPRRFMDLFSMRLSSGRRVVRKDKHTGAAVIWDRDGQLPRVPMAPNTYLDREKLVASNLAALMEERNGEESS